MATHDRNLDPIPDVIISHGGIVTGNTDDGRTWLASYRIEVADMVPPLRRLAADAGDDGLSVEDRR